MHSLQISPTMSAGGVVYYLAYFYNKTYTKLNSVIFLVRFYYFCVCRSNNRQLSDVHNIVINFPHKNLIEFGQIRHDKTTFHLISQNLQLTNFLHFTSFFVDPSLELFSDHLLLSMVWMTMIRFGYTVWSGDLYICQGYSMYTWEGKLFLSPFTVVQTKVVPPSH